MKHIKEYLDVFLVLRFPMWSYPWFCFSKSEKIRLHFVYQNMARIWLFVAEFFFLTEDSRLRCVSPIPYQFAFVFLCFSSHLPMPSSQSPARSWSLSVPAPISFHHLPASLTLTVCLFSVTLVPRISPGFILQQFPHSKQFCTSYEYSYTSKFSRPSKRKKVPFLLL